MEVELLRSAPDPITWFETVRDHPYALLLDSGTDPDRLGRYSFVATDPWAVVRSRGRRTEILTCETGESRIVDDDPLLVVRALLHPHMVTAPREDLPPFQGGAAGYIGYDYGATLERVPRARYADLDVDDVVIGMYGSVMAWDHHAGTAWRISHDGTTNAGGLKAAPTTGRTTGRANAPVGGMNAGAGGINAAPTYPVSGYPGLRSTFTHDGYLAMVDRARDYIMAGDIYQANLSQRLEAPYAGDPWALYSRLRTINPAPFAAYFDTGDSTIVSASPERFLRMTADGAIETRPIKGTLPRGWMPEHDAALGLALAESEKDRAEHVMIVDLLRNDLSRVCTRHSVQVPELFALETYATVHHLVSTIVGQLRPGLDAADLIRAAFPGGSITGAPKIRAMEIIAELEPLPRGVYCGSVGYWSVTGALDTSIVIRTFLVQQGRAYFSAGGGIVADSDPESEYRETFDKARALIAALDLA